METRVCLNPDKKGLRRQIQNFSIQLIGEEGCAGLCLSASLWIQLSATVPGKAVWKMAQVLRSLCPQGRPGKTAGLTEPSPGCYGKEPADGRLDLPLSNKYLQRYSKETRNTGTHVDYLPVFCYITTN